MNIVISPEYVIYWWELIILTLASLLGIFCQLVIENKSHVSIAEIIYKVLGWFIAGLCVLIFIHAWIASDNEIKFKKYLIKWTIKAVKKTINSNETHINDIENLSILIERFLIKAPKKFVLRKPLWVKHKSKYENNINYQNYVDSQFLTYVNQIMHVLESLR